MVNTGLNNFEKSLKKTYAWLDDLTKELGYENNKETYLLFKAVVQSIRDILTIERAIHLGEQFPMIIKGFYYENWNPFKNEINDKKMYTFLALVSKKYQGHKVVDSVGDISITLHFLSKKISKNEIKEIEAIIPQEIVSFWSVSENYKNNTRY